MTRNSPNTMLGFRHLIAQAEFDEALHSSKLEPGHTAERHIETRQEKFFSAMGYKELLNNALKNMPLIFREVIALHEIEGLSYKEIAMSSVYRWGVASRLPRGGRRLQTVLSKRLKKRGTDGRFGRDFLYRYPKVTLLTDSVSSLMYISDVSFHS